MSTEAAPPLANPKVRLLRLAAVGCVCFALGYLGARWQGDDSRKLAARVNGEGVSVVELRRELISRFGPDVLRDLVHQRLILQEARRQQIVTDPKQLETRLAAMKQQPEVQAMLKAGQVAESDLRRNLSIMMPLEALVQARISPDQEKEYWEQHRGELETLTVAHILVKDPAQAESVRAQASKPKADFAALARQYSLDPRTKERGGELGELRRGELDPEVAESLFAVAPGQISPAIAGEDGLHIFKVLAKKNTLEQLRPQIREVLVAAQRGEYLEELRAAAKIEAVPPYRLPTSRSQVNTDH